MHSGPIIPAGEVLPPMESKPSSVEHPEADAGYDTKAKQPHQRGRFAVLNAFADYGARLVNPTAQACWWIVFRETKPDGLARISHGRIAECVGVSRVTVTRALRRLDRAGLLTTVRRGGLRAGASTYRVHGTPRRARSPT